MLMHGGRNGRGDVWKQLKKHRTSIAIYTISVLISGVVILSQQKLIRDMNQEKQEMNKNIEKLEHQISNNDTENFDETTLNVNNNNPSSAFWNSFNTTTLNCATRVVVGTVLGK